MDVRDIGPNGVASFDPYEAFTLQAVKENREENDRCATRSRTQEGWGHRDTLKGQRSAAALRCPFIFGLHRPSGDPDFLALLLGQCAHFRKGQFQDTIGVVGGHLLAIHMLR